MRNFGLHRFNDAAQAHCDKQKVHEFDLHRAVLWLCFAACCTIALFRYVQVFKSKHGPEPGSEQTWVGMHISADLFKSLLELRWWIQLCIGLWVKLSGDYKKNIFEYILTKRVRYYISKQNLVMTGTSLGIGSEDNRNS